MSDHSSTFDARRIGWWARRRAVRQIRKSTAITDADRALRMQQAGAAQTRGEIHALTQGLSPTGPAAAPWTPPARPTTGTPPARPLAPNTPPPAQQPPVQPPSSWRPPTQVPPVPQPFAHQPPARKKSAARPVVIGLIVVLVTCGGGLVSCVSSVVDGVREGSSSSPTPVTDPQTEDGWNEMVDAFDDEADLSETVSLLVRRSAATLSVKAGDRAAARYYFDGDVTSATEVRRMPNEQLFDLDDIDASVITATVARARRSAGEPESTEAWVHIWAIARGTRIVVTFPTGTSDTYALAVETDGTTVSETP